MWVGTSQGAHGVERLCPCCWAVRVSSLEDGPFGISTISGSHFDHVRLRVIQLCSYQSPWAARMTYHRPSGWGSGTTSLAPKAGRPRIRWLLVGSWPGLLSWPPSRCVLAWGQAARALMPSSSDEAIIPSQAPLQDPITSQKTHLKYPGIRAARINLGGRNHLVHNSVLYMLWKQARHQIHHVRISSPVSWTPLPFLHDVC